MCQITFSSMLALYYYPLIRPYINQLIVKTNNIHPIDLHKALNFIRSPEITSVFPFRLLFVFSNSP